MISLDKRTEDAHTSLVTEVAEADLPPELVLFVTLDVSDTDFLDVIAEFFTPWLPAARSQGITRC